MELRTAVSPRDVKTYTTQRLREEFLIQGLFVPGEIKLVYSHIDCIITEVLCTKLISCGQLKCTLCRCCTSCDNTIDVAIYQLDFAWYKQSLNQKFLSESLCGISLDISWTW